MTMPERKHLRLAGYDYRMAGAYFITICAWNHQCLFGSIEPVDELGNVRNNLSRYGEIVEAQIAGLEKQYPFVCIHRSVVMPNHLHLLLSFSENSPETVMSVIGRMKSLATRECWKLGYPEKHLFQLSFYEHIVRNDQEFEEIWQYIEGNPSKWCEDRYYYSS